MTRFFAFLCRFGFHDDRLYLYEDREEMACRRCGRCYTISEYDPYDEIVCP